MEKLKDSLKFNLWKNKLKENGVEVSNIKEIHSIRKRNGEVLFSMLTGNFETPEGVNIPPVVVLRGHYVSIMTILKNKENDEKWLLLAKQRRIADGSWIYAHPAGMCDSETDIYAVAIKEMLEETGLKINREDLVLLNNEPLFTSPGLLDEGGYLFYTELEMTSSEIEELRGKFTGMLDDYEHIQLEVVSMEEALGLIRSIGSLLTIYWYLNNK